MYPNTYMPSTLMIGYKRKILGPISSVPLTLFYMMNVCFAFDLIFFVTSVPTSIPIFGKGSAAYKIPYNYHDLWVVVGRNSSGQLFFDTDLLSRKVFIWKPYNDSVLPTIFLDEEPPKVLQDPVPPITTGDLTGTLPKDIRVPHQSALEKGSKKRFPPNSGPESIRLTHQSLPR